MNTTLRLVLSLTALGLAILVVLMGLCYVVSIAELGVSFITLAKVNIWFISIPRFPIFNIQSMLKWLLQPGNIGDAYLANPYMFLMPFIAGAVLWLFFEYVAARIIRLISNRKTTLHGSAKWATEEELASLGMLGNTGVVLGQTADAKYVEVEKKPPRRKDCRSAEEYNEKRINFTPGTYYSQQHAGDLIMQSNNAHMLIVGSTRSGKGISCIIPTEFKWPESIIIFDPKAEGWDVSAAFRSRFSYTFKFQPEQPTESIHYNPLLAIRRGTFTMPDIQNLCLSLIALNEQSKDPFWDNEARKLLAAVIGYVIYCMPPERKTFREVYSIFTSQDEAFNQSQMQNMDDDDDETPVQKRLRFYSEQTALYMDYARNNLMMSPELREKFDKRWTLSLKERKKIEEQATGRLTNDDLENLERIRQDLEYFSSCESRQLSSVVSTMTSNLQVIADPNVQAVTDRSDFTMEDFVDGIPDENGKRRPVSLYLCMSLASMQRLIPIMKIFYEQAITLLTRCTPEECKKRPYRLLLIFDEFRQMGKMDIVEKALALSAGYGILCMIAVQSYEQLKTLYQSDALFTDNFAYQVILRVNDDATCKKVESMLGQSTMRHTKLNSSGSLGNIVHKHESLDTSEMARSLMTAEEVRTMPENDCLVIMSGTHPYRAKKVRYYQDKRFTKLYRMNNGKGKAYPVPKLMENLPHPETIEYEGKSTKIKTIHGLDREGWSLLLGVDTDASSLQEEVKEQDIETSADDNFLEDVINDEMHDEMLEKGFEDDYKDMSDEEAAELQIPGRPVEEQGDMENDDATAYDVDDMERAAYEAFRVMLANRQPGKETMKAAITGV